LFSRYGFVLSLVFASSPEKGPLKALSLETLRMSRKNKRRENAPRRVGGTYSGNHPGVKAKRGKNRPKMKGLALFCRRDGRIPLHAGAARPPSTGRRGSAAQAGRGPGNLDR
jgi:hypothetical protein